MPSVALSLGAVLTVIYGLQQTAQDGLAPLPALSILAGLVAGVIFVRRQRDLADPLIDLGLFGERTFSVSLGALTLSAVVMGGVGYLVAQYLQLVLGLSPLQAGLWMLPPLGVGIVSMMLAPLIVRRVAPGFVIGAGLALAAAGFAVISRVGDASGLAVVVTGYTLVFAGLMPVSALGVDIVVSAAPPARAGAASAISETTQELGLALGIAILGSISTAVHRGQITDAIPAGVAPDAAESARDTLGGAAGAADQLSHALLSTAAQAFTDGMRVAAAISAVALVGMALLAAIVLRRVRADTGRRPDDTQAAGAHVAQAPRAVPAASRS